MSENSEEPFWGDWEWVAKRLPSPVMGETFFSNSCLVYHGRGSRSRRPMSQIPSRSEVSDVVFSWGKNNTLSERNYGYTDFFRKIYGKLLLLSATHVYVCHLCASSSGLGQQDGVGASQQKSFGLCQSAATDRSDPPFSAPLGTWPL